MNQNLATDQFVFAEFIESICIDLEANPASQYDNLRVFMWDNLSAHLTAHVHETVKNREGDSAFEIVARPPYQPKVAPIEYKICDVCLALQRFIDRTDDLDSLEVRTYKIVAAAGMGGNFDRTFAHCGYTVDGLYPLPGEDPRYDNP